MSWRRRLWPVAPALLIGSGIASVFVGSLTAASTATLLTRVAVPIAMAIVVAGIAVGGRRGLVVAASLTGLAVYWAWWFGWGLTANISPYSIDLAASGLAEAALYELELLLNLWPLTLAAVVVVVVMGRRRERPVWTALGVLCLTLVVLSLPSRASWTDGCNDTTGAAPLIARPATQLLMDHGIGVLPSGMQTQAGCSSTADRQWKPFWLGDDQLPPPPGLYGRTIAISVTVPTRLYRTPTPLPGRRLHRVALTYWPERNSLYVVVATDQELATARPPAWPPIDLRIDGVKFDDDEGLGVQGTRGWCYSAVWVDNPRLPEHQPGTVLRVDLEYRGRRLATGRARVALVTTEEQDRHQGKHFGCPPKW